MNQALTKIAATLLLAAPIAVATPGVAHADWYMEAESIPQSSTSYPIVVGTGWGANNNAFLELNWEGGPYSQFYVSAAGYYQVNALVAGSVCSGYPYVAFYIDAYLTGSHAVGPGWSHQTSDARYLTPGWHSFAVALQGDYAGGGCDRNLWWDAAWMYGATSR